MANWIIDRTINLDEFKTREVLKQLLLEPRQSDEIMEEVLNIKGVLKNSSDGALRRRWYTYLRNYGFMRNDEVTEVGKYYAESKLSLKEVSLLQLMKKKIKFALNDNEFYPFKIIILLLENLRNINIKEAYISREEFVNFICQLGSNNQNEIFNLANRLVQNRNNNLEINWIDGQHDDVWFNTLEQTGLFNYYGRSLYVNNWEMFNQICSFYSEEMVGTDFGDFNFSFINNIPFPRKANNQFNLFRAKEIKDYSQLLFDFLFVYDNERKIEDKYFGNKKKYKGVKEFLDNLNIDRSNIALYKIFSNYPNILITKLENSQDEEFKEIAKILQETSLHNKVNENISDVRNNETIDNGENIILYGVPGSGKSHTIKEEYCNDDNYIERIVFHPDYTYSDFIGQILPKAINGTVNYTFEPGPFTKILKKAYLNPDEKYYLIIEEINRGNAPAIFGDIFQLLDRDSIGRSEYSITNGDIAKIVFENEDKKIYIPFNMSIIGTMNTSDQNVFTLDTAFQRRWKMRLIKNKFKDTQEENLFANAKILDTDVTWRKFLTEINHIILSKNIRMTSSEDKRLGTHFINKEDLKFDSSDNEKNNRFTEKVLKYLWDDAFKFTKEDIFDLEKVKSLEEVIELFAKANNNERFKVFKENIYTVLVSQVNNNS